jgi:hypothetical protein
MRGHLAARSNELRPVTPELRELTDETVERLRALAYLD